MIFSSSPDQDLNPTAFAGQMCWLNGVWTPLAQASVPVLDRGFIFGDGIYEVVPVYQRVAFRWREHRARLSRSLAKLRIDDPLSDAQWRTLIDELVERHPWDDQFVYLQVTRGVAARDHAFPRTPVRPTLFAMSSQLKLPDAALRASGVAAISLPDERWLHCDIKSISLLGNILARQAAVEAGGFECVMYRDGFLTEGSASNLWVVRDQRLYAPPRDQRILEGIRYGLIAELCAEESIEFIVRPIARAEVESADELLMSSATKEVLPITRLDGRPVGHGTHAGVPGPIAQRLHSAYQRAWRRTVAQTQASAGIGLDAATTTQPNQAQEAAAPGPAPAGEPAR
jgi:D-alanine transaminase